MASTARLAANLIDARRFIHSTRRCIAFDSLPILCSADVKLGAGTTHFDSAIFYLSYKLSDGNAIPMPGASMRSIRDDLAVQGDRSHHYFTPSSKPPFSSAMIGPVTMRALGLSGRVNHADRSVRGRLCGSIMASIALPIAYRFWSLPDTASETRMLSITRPVGECDHQEGSLAGSKIGIELYE
jgi:hypothetical protein